MGLPKEFLLQWPTNVMQLKRTAANVQIKGLQKGLPGDTVPGRVNWTLDFLLIGAAKFALGLASHPGSIRLERPYQG